MYVKGEGERKGGRERGNGEKEGVEQGGEEKKIAGKGSREGKERNYTWTEGKGDGE